MAECQTEVANAERDLRAASIALITARAGPSAGDGDMIRKWQGSGGGDWVDKESERIESGKAAVVAAVAGAVASLPFVLSERGVGFSSVFGVFGVLVSCGVFGVCYRYTVRRDLDNFQLKSGAAAAFALVAGT